MPVHAERRVLPYAPEQLFDLVADVESYPEFLPWCLALRVVGRDGRGILAEMTVGFGPFRERFASRVSLSPKKRIDVAYLDGPFRRMANRWLFLPAGDGCELDFFIDFEFRSRLLRGVVEPLFHGAVQRMVRAFEDRAAERCGSA